MFALQLNHRTLFTRGVLVTVLACVSITGCQQPRSAFVYPDAPRSDQVDEYHGVKVADPFRPLENPDAPETKAWIEAENKITQDYLRAIPSRDAIKDRLTTLWDYEKYGRPVIRGDRYFFTMNDGLQNQSVLYTMRGRNGTPKVVLDPNKFSEDGTVALAGWVPSHDGRLLAYGVSKSGSDWQEWKVYDLAVNHDRNDVIKWVKFSNASWSADDRGFYYSRYDEPKEATQFEDVNYYQKLYYHRIGQKQRQDKLVYQRPDEKEWGFGGTVSDDGRFLIINVWKGTDPKNLLFYKDLTDPDAKIVELINQFEAVYDFVDNDGSVLWLRTDLDAPRARLIAIDTKHPAGENWKELIPEAKETLRSVSSVGDRLIASYLKDAHTQVKVFYTDGTFSRDVDLPGIGTAGGFSGKRSDTYTHYSFTGFTNPGSIYRYDIATGKSTVFRRPKVDFDPSRYVTKQIFYRSKDGTRVPMFITHMKGLKLDGSNPTLLYGYGGFDIPITPSFRVSRLVWMELGGVYAVANIRGGGEYGKAWHEAGMKTNKQNVFDDFIAAGEWLIAHKYTSKKKLAIFGGSNGGLLVGACITQRPDLYGAAIAAVGVMDMLRFKEFTIGWAWVSDYGTPDNPEEFKALYAYSPLHNLKDGVAYPSMLITTADHDDRVVPAHSFKFAARIQEAQAGRNPVLIRIETKAGHGAGKPTSKRIQEAADMWAFLFHELDAKPAM